MFVPTSPIVVRIKYENPRKELAHIKNFINGKYYYYPDWVALNIITI